MTKLNILECDKNIMTKLNILLLDYDEKNKTVVFNTCESFDYICDNKLNELIKCAKYLLFSDNDMHNIKLLLQILKINNKQKLDIIMMKILLISVNNRNILGVEILQMYILSKYNNLITNINEVSEFLINMFDFLKIKKINMKSTTNYVKLFDNITDIGIEYLRSINKKEQNIVKKMYSLPEPIYFTFLGDNFVQYFIDVNSNQKQIIDLIKDIERITNCNNKFFDLYQKIKTKLFSVP